MTYHFSTNLLSYPNDDVLSWNVSPDQFMAIQERCSGNPIPARWASAQEWAKVRSAFLHTEALAYVKSGIIAYAEEYSHAVQHCAYHVDDENIAYQTTSGTRFLVAKSGLHGVGLPKDRAGGSHHMSILLVLAGITSEQRDRWEKTYLLPKSTPDDVFESLWNEMKEVYDRVLVPHGYDPQRTYADVSADRLARRERL